MKTTTTKPSNDDKEFSVMQDLTLDIKEVIAYQDDKGNVNKVYLVDKEGKKISWTPEIEVLDKTGVFPTLTTKKSEIKVLDLPQVFHNMHALIVKNGSVKVTVSVSVLKVSNEKGTKEYYFLSQKDFKTLEIRK